MFLSPLIIQVSNKLAYLVLWFEYEVSLECPRVGGLVLIWWYYEQYLVYEEAGFVSGLIQREIPNVQASSRWGFLGGSRSLL